MGRQLLAVPQTQVDPAELTDKLHEYRTQEGETVRGIKADEDTSSRIEELTEESKTEEKERDWIDNIKDSIPVEVVAAWTAVFAVFTASPDVISSRFYLGTIILGALATVLHMWSDIDPLTEEEQKRLAYTNTEVAIRMWLQILLAVGAFLAWVYSLQATNNTTLPSPVEFVPFNEAYAAVLLPLYLLLGPQLLPEVLNKLHDTNYFNNYDAITRSSRRKSHWFMFISLVGTWMLISAFVFPALSGASYWNNIIIGLSVFLIAGYDSYRMANGRSVNLSGAVFLMLLGIWMVLIPFTLTSVGTALFWSNIISGAFVAIVAGYTAYLTREVTKSVPTGGT